MAVNDSLIYALPQELVESFSGLVIVFQVLGGAIVLYIVFNIINFFTNRKKNKELQLINQNLQDIKQILMMKENFRQNKEAKK